MAEISSVLVVDDERIVRDVLSRYLVRDGYEVLTAADAASAHEIILHRQPSLLILDIMLPGTDGLDLCRRVRRSSDLPIILLSGRCDPADRSVGLDIGADDYVGKPFSPREVVARVRALLRRRYTQRPADRLVFDGLSIDRSSREVTSAGRPVHLTAIEFDILWCLTVAPRVVIPRSQLMERIWGYAPTTDTGALTVHVARLRRKLNEDPLRPRHIETIRGVGYRFSP